MRGKKLFLQKKLKFFGLLTVLCLCGALLAYGGYKIFAAIITSDEARVNENDTLIYYITVNSDAIDYTGTESSETQTASETSGITTVTDTLPDGLIFQGFVTSEDGTFGAVQRDDRVTQCAGSVIDDTNEESITEGAWNANNSEYTYHGLHYDVATRTVTFRTKAIGAGCELTVGVETKTPTLPEGVFRMDFYDHASFVDESLFGDSNEVHAWIQKDTLPGEYSLSYRYDGKVPAGAPELPAKSYYSTNNAEITVAAKPTLEGYTFDGWYYDAGYYTKQSADNLTALPNQSVELYGSWSKNGGGEIPDPPVENPVKYDVTYQVDGTKPADFNTPAKRSYYEGASVDVDSTNAQGDNIDGYDFSGWSTTDVTVTDDSFTMPKKNVLLRGSFDQRSYTVSYEFIGDVAPENAASLLPASSEHHAGDDITVAAAPSADGYTFSGWFANPSFEMPAEDVVIKGEWTKNKIEFTPEIAVEITNPQDEFHKGDTVDFKITVTNGEDFALNNVWLQELLDGAVFVEGDGYTIDENSFAMITTIPANSSAVVYAKYPVTKNIDKTYTNTVELIALDSSNSDYILPNDWDNTASVDFKTVAVEDEPIDEDDEPEKEEKNAKTYDGAGKMIISGMTLGGGLALCVVLCKRMRRGGIIYGYCAAIMTVSGLAVVLINGGFSFADTLTETKEMYIRSSKLNYMDGEAGSWQVYEKAEWTGVGETMLDVEVRSKKISDLHNKDVLLILDNGVWTKNAIDGSEPDSASDLPAMDLMKRDSKDFVSDLLSDGDSKIAVFSIWGNEGIVMTSDEATAIAQVDAITSTTNTNYNSYSVAYDKVLSFLAGYEQSDDRALNIVLVSDDHVASSSEIAKYEMVKAKAPDAVISGIGFGNMEILSTRYTTAENAFASGAARYWIGVDGNLRPIRDYSGAVNGLDKVADYHETPYEKDFTAALTRAVDGSLVYDKFNLTLPINTTDFDIIGIYGNVGDFEVNEGTISWKNENKGLVSGARYNMSVLLRAKDESVALHKLYQLNTGTTVETDASDIEADTVTANNGIVLMNGYQLSFDDNNDLTCSLGNNQSGVYLAYQKIAIDEDNVSCDGWNFINFKSATTGDIFGAVNDKMPAEDTTLKATWRKVGVEVHMDGQVYVVASATLLPGIQFNQKMLSVSGDNGNTVLRRAEGCPENRKQQTNLISTEGSPAIYAWKADTYSYRYDHYDYDNSTYYYSALVWYCSDADTIKLNEDSNSMFANDSRRLDPDDYTTYTELRSAIKMVDESVAEWDASEAKDMSYMFDSSLMGIKALAHIGSWEPTSLENADNILLDKTVDSSASVNADALSWDTPNLKSLRYAFSESERVFDKMPGIANWDTDKVTDMSYAFYQTASDSYAPLAGWNVSNVEDMEGTFKQAGSTYSSITVDFSGISGWKPNKVKNFKETFAYTTIPNMGVLGGWNVSGAETLERMFASAKFTTKHEGAADAVGDTSAISGWRLNSAKNISEMFRKSNIASTSGLAGWGTSTQNIENFSGVFAETAITSTDGLGAWSTASATTMASIFENDTSLTDINALTNWTVSNVENLNSAFRGISVANLEALEDWNVSNVRYLNYTFCGAPQAGPSGSYVTMECDSTANERQTKVSTTSVPYGRGNYGGPQSLEGLEGWKDKTGNIEYMSGTFAGGVITDLTPIKDWNVKKVKWMDKTFMHMNVESFSILSGWETDSLESLQNAFAFSKAKNLSGIGSWNAKKLDNASGTFRDMYNLDDISALSGWETESLTSVSGMLMDHKKLASLHGLEGWDVSKVTGFSEAFLGYGTYRIYNDEDWSLYCNNQLTDISALQNWSTSSGMQFDGTFACNDKLVSLAPLANWRVHNGSYFTHIFEGDKSVITLNGLQNWFADANTSLESTKTINEFNKGFMYMTSLQDITALGSWQSSKTKVNNVTYLMAHDGDINTPLTTLDGTIFDTVSKKSYTTNAFDGVPGGLARPSWYNALQNP